MDIQTVPPAAAVEVAATYKAEPKRAIDNEYGDPCWVGYEWPDSALVIYDDEADAVVATGNHPGRFTYV